MTLVDDIKAIPTTRAVRVIPGWFKCDFYKVKANIAGLRKGQQQWRIWGKTNDKVIDSSPTLIGIRQLWWNKLAMMRQVKEQGKLDNSLGTIDTLTHTNKGTDREVQGMSSRGWLENRWDQGMKDKNEVMMENQPIMRLRIMKRFWGLSIRVQITAAEGWATQ